MDNELIIPGSGRAVVAAVARAFGFGLDDLTGRARHKEVVRARNAAAWLLRRQLVPSGAPGQLRPRSFNQVAAILARDDHSSIIHACRSCEAAMAREPAYKAKVQLLEAGRADFAPLDMALRGHPSRSEPRPREVAQLPPRSVKHKNALADDDHDAVMRFNGSAALLAAINLAHPRVAAAA